MIRPGGEAPRPAARGRRLAAVLALATVVVAADQVTKSLAVDQLARGPVHLFGPVSFELAYNTGVAFSLGSGLTVPIVVVAATLAGVVVWLARGAPNAAQAGAFGLVLGGALGNLADRLFRGHAGAVVDFVRVGFWPTFNVADACIVCGCAALAVGVWRRASRGVPPGGDQSHGSPPLDPPARPSGTAAGHLADSGGPR